MGLPSSSSSSSAGISRGGGGERRRATTLANLPLAGFPVASIVYVTCIPPSRPLDAATIAPAPSPTETFIGFSVAAHLLHLEFAILKFTLLKFFSHCAPTPTRRRRRRRRRGEDPLDGHAFPEGFDLDDDASFMGGGGRASRVGDLKSCVGALASSSR